MTTTCLDWLAASQGHECAELGGLDDDAFAQAMACALDDAPGWLSDSEIDEMADEYEDYLADVEWLQRGC